MKTKRKKNARVSSSKLRGDLAETLNLVKYTGERVVLARNGKNIAALVPLEDLTILELLEDVIDLKAAREALAKTGREGTIAWEDLKKKLRR